MILGDKGDLNLRNLAYSWEISPTYSSKWVSAIFCLLWIIWSLAAGDLMLTVGCASTMVLLGIIGIIPGKVFNHLHKSPAETGIPLTYVGVIGSPNFLDAIIELEIRYPGAGKSFLYQWEDKPRKLLDPLDAPKEVTIMWEELKKFTSDPNRLAKIQVLQQNRSIFNTVIVLLAKSEST